MLSVRACLVSLVHKSPTRRALVTGLEGHGALLSLKRRNGVGDGVARGTTQPEDGGGTHGTTICRARPEAWSCAMYESSLARWATLPTCTMHSYYAVPLCARVGKDSD